MVDTQVLRRILDEGNLDQLACLLAEDPGLASRTFYWGSGCSIGPCEPISYLAQARFNGFVRHQNSGLMTGLLLGAGALLEGPPGASETPLVTAASYNELEVARAMVDAGANLAATGRAVQPNGTALAHSIEFGAVEIADLLVAAGSPLHSLRQVAGAGAKDLATALAACTDAQEKAFALRAAAICNRLDAIDLLLAAGVAVNALINGGTALHWAAWEAKALSARHLVERGADPGILDPQYNMTPLGWARHRSGECPHAHPGGHGELIAFLESLPLP